MVVVVVGMVVVVVVTVVVVVDVVVVLDDDAGGVVGTVESAAVSAAQPAATTVAMHTIPSERIVMDRIEPIGEAPWVGAPDTVGLKARSRDLSTRKSRQERPNRGTLRPT